MMSISLNCDFHFLNEDGSIRTEIGHTATINAVGQIPGGFVYYSGNMENYHMHAMVKKQMEFQFVLLYQVMINLLLHVQMVL